MQVIPTILEKSFERAQNKIEQIKKLSKWVQIDVIDNKFADGKTIELELLNKLDTDIDDLLLDVHLMVKEPIKWIEKCLFVNANRMIGQVEMMTNTEEFIKAVKDAGLDVGLAFDVDTELLEIPEETDIVLLMGRKAGFEPQEFDKKIIDKIKTLKNIREKKGLEFLIGVDGGINIENIGMLKNLGVDIAYCGGAIFNGNVNDNLGKLTYASQN